MVEVNHFFYIVSKHILDGNGFGIVRFGRRGLYLPKYAMDSIIDKSAKEIANSVSEF